MFLKELRRRVEKAGQLPGTPLYTGDNLSTISQVTVATYCAENAQPFTGTDLTVLSANPDPATKVTWINVS